MPTDEKRHADTLVLRSIGRPRGSSYADFHRDQRSIGIHGRRNPDERLPAKTLVYGLESDGSAAAVSLRP